MLLNRDVGFVRAGQSVALKVDAFFTRYGLLHGTVVGVSRDAADGGDGSGGVGSGHDDGRGDDERAAGRNGRSVYVAHVAILDTPSAQFRAQLTLQAGMQVTADIKTGRRSLMSYLLSPLARRVGEGMRER